MHDNLVDIHSVNIDKTLPAAQRVEQYLAQIRDPYCYRHGDSVVRLRFHDDGGELKDRLRSFFISCKQA